jgi:hypothetical protein
MTDPIKEFLKRQERSWRLLRLQRDFYGSYLFGYGLSFKPDYTRPQESALELREVMRELGGRAYDPQGTPRESLEAREVLREALAIAAKDPLSGSPEERMIRESRISGSLGVSRVPSGSLGGSLAFKVLEDLADSSEAQIESPLWSVASISPELKRSLGPIRKKALKTFLDLRFPRVPQNLLMTQRAHLSEIETFIEGFMIYEINPQALKRISKELYKIIKDSKK